MGTTAVVIGAKPGSDDSLVAVQGWEACDYPSMGEPDQIRLELNERIATAGIATQWFDESSSVCLPDGVEAISFSLHAGLLRSIWITRPTGELLEILCQWARVVGWRVYNADSETEYTAEDFTQPKGGDEGVH
ncbi:MULTISPECIES: hypothetical protein [unclassified Mycolicibacterium]|uniref:hypothetical protein n=1 Tax=unclassified Mycolicibacterium TaxID=2636767 RepID=UPI0012DFAF9C|nr:MULTISPECIES: hypothetical protein [unclassified Mycolicibacterium]MUL80761.1 hypothetical protein [Mycolicibacterium sp. CBMA 329]MUL86528.1 hypothetical protein [Mycolicibacterium sp. CBMA 331]MUM01389.1 hypothetical protein [Mycolicibacterium sp. CBMA 334]MUM25898.1 hypothetical protein [Mycolicibacterium sp. CBMA 295]MUM36824.1 hypothetical protein [Mycolicibacterium sp. CBMA 247]